MINTTVNDKVQAAQSSSSTLSKMSTRDIEQEQSFYEKSFVMMPMHDLESLFYILLWICSNYSRANNAVRTDSKYKNIP